MVISGFSSVSDIPLEAGVEATSINRVGDFSGLLLLMVAGLVTQNALINDHNEGSGAPVCSQDVPIGEGLSCSGAGVVESKDKFAESFVHETPGSTFAIIETYQYGPTPPGVASGGSAWASDPPPLEANGHKIISPGSSGSRENHMQALLRGTPETSLGSSENPPVEADALDQTTWVGQHDVTDILFEEHIPTAGVPVDLAVATSPPDNFPASFGARNPERTGRLQVNLGIEPRNLDALSREDRKDANGTFDQATLRSVAESVSAGEVPESGAESVYGDDIFHHAVLATSSEEISPHPDRSEPVQQLHPLRTRNPNSQMVPERIQNVDLVRPPVTGHGEQRFTFQHDDFRGSGELLETAARITPESASPGAVPFHLAYRDQPPTMRTDDLRGINWHRTVDRIVGEIDGRIRFGKQEAILQLDPPELGKLRIDLHMAGDKVTARILTETHQSRTLIEMHLGELRQALGENRVELMNVRVDSFSWTGTHGESQQEMYRESNDHRDPMPAFEPAGPDSRDESHPVRQVTALYRPGSVSMWA